MKFKFDVEAAIESLDDVPAEFHGFYSKTAAGYAVQDVLKASAKVINAMGGNLAAAEGKTKTAREEAAAARIKYAGVDELLASLEGEDKTPAALKARLEALSATAKGADPEAIKNQVDSLRRQMTDAHSAEKTALQNQLKTMESELYEHLVVAQATAAVAAAKGVPEFLLPTIRNAARVVRDNGKLSAVVVGADGNPIVDAAGSPISIATYVETLKKDKTYGRAFDGEVKQSVTAAAPGNRQRVAVDTQAEMSAVDKIAAGLAKR